MKQFFTLITLFFTMTVFAANNLVVNGDFSNGTDDWSVKYSIPSDSSIYTLSVNDNILTITQPTKPNNRMDFWQDITIAPNTNYTLSFEYTATHKKFRLWADYMSDNGNYSYIMGGKDSAAIDPFRTYNGYYDATTEFVKKELQFTTPQTDTITTFCLVYRVYKQLGATVQLRNVSLVAEDTPSNISNPTSKKSKNIIIKDGVLYINTNDNIYTILGNQQ